MALICYMVELPIQALCLVAKAVEHLPNTTENANFSLNFSGLATFAASSNLFGVCVCMCVRVCGARVLACV